jgi:iron complex outermembrane recepter protein
MPKKTRLCISLLLAFGCASTLAQQEVQRIEITGSSIKRIAAEGSVPMLTLTREEIDKSGAVSVTELIQRLSPAPPPPRCMHWAALTHWCF